MLQKLLDDVIALNSTELLARIKAEGMDAIQMEDFQAIVRNYRLALQLRREQVAVHANDAWAGWNGQTSMYRR